MGSMKRGSILMEFVLTMPILFVLIMLILQFAQIMVARQFVAYAAFCSTRSMLCSNPAEWRVRNSKHNCAFQAARRVLAWVNILGTPETADKRGREEGYATVGAGDFSDIGDKTTEAYTTMMYGSKETQDVLIPGWGQVPESNSVDRRLDVTPGVYQGKCVWSTVKYKFPLLIPVAGQMIGFGMLDGVPYIELTETCVLPLPYSTAALPGNNPLGIGTAFDYTTYD